MASGDLIASLRALDAELAAIAPRPALEARLRARLRAASATRWPPGGTLARLAWPVGAVAAGAAIVMALGEGGRRRTEVAGGDPEQDGPGVAAVKERADAGPAEGDPERARPAPRPIHAPSVDPWRAREDGVRRAPPVVDRAPMMINVDQRHQPIQPRSAPRDEAAVLPANSARPRVEPPKVNLGQPPGGGAVAEPPRPSLGPMRGVPSGRVRPAEIPTHDLGAEITPSGCRTADALAQEALALCTDEGRELASYALLDPCGDATYRGVKPTCAAPTKPDTCITAALDGTFSCADGGELKTQAYLACDAAGLLLVGIELDASQCTSPGGRVTASYQCCPAPSPSPGPAPAACVELELGDGDACLDLATFKAQASAACESKGSELADLQPSTDGCPASFAAKIAFTCCDR